MRLANLRCTYTLKMQKLSLPMNSFDYTLTTSSRDKSVVRTCLWEVWRWRGGQAESSPRSPSTQVSSSSCSGKQNVFKLVLSTQKLHLSLTCTQQTRILQDYIFLSTQNKRHRVGGDSYEITGIFPLM